MKIKIKSIILVLVCLLILNIPYLSQKMNNMINLVIESFLLIYMFTKLHTKHSLKSNIYVLLFWLLMVMCTFLNFKFTSRTLNAFVTGAQYFLLFYYISYFSKKDSLQSVVNLLWKYFLFVILIADFIVILSGGNGIWNQDIVQRYYLIGNKFTVSYYHMFVLSLFLAQNVNVKRAKHRNLIFFLLLAYSIFICRVIDCNTGIVGCLVIALVHLISFRKNNLIEIMSKPTTIITFFVLSTFLLVGTDLLLNNQYINNIFIKYSHTSKLLSGRLDMYAITLNGIKAALWMGHGINCTLVQDILSWGNPQNGLLKMLLDFGIIGTASFLLLIYDSTKNNRNNNKQIEYSMLAFVYGMIICSMVEINLSGLFYLGLVLLKMSKRDVQKNF